MKIANTSINKSGFEPGTRFDVRAEPLSLQSGIDNRLEDIGRPELEISRFEKKIIHNNRAKDLEKEGLTASEILVRGIDEDCREYVRFRTSNRPDEAPMQTDSVKGYKACGDALVGDGIYSKSCAKRAVQSLLNQHAFDEKIICVSSS